MRIHDSMVRQQRLHSLECIDNFNEPRIVIKECAVSLYSESLVEFLQFNVGPRSAATFGDIESSQGSDPVDALRIPVRLEVRSLQVGLAQARFANEGRVIFGDDLVFDDASIGAAEARS